MLADLADLAHHADSTLVLGVVLGSIKRALLERGAAVNRGVAGGADLKLSELVKFDLNRVVRAALALRLGFPRLSHGSARGPQNMGSGSAYVVYDLARASVGQNTVGKAQGRVVVLAPDRQIHGIQQSQLTMRNLDLRDGEVG